MGVEDPRMDDGVARVKVLIFLQVDLGYQCRAEPPPISDSCRNCNERGRTNNLWMMCSPDE